MKKIKKKKNILKRFIIFFAAVIFLFLFLVALFYAAINNIGYISEKFLKRKLQYSKIDFYLLSGKLSAEDISFSNLEGDELFKIKKIIVDFSFFSRLKP
nr:hypothetical protein [Spirochaetota bacterium]